MKYILGDDSINGIKINEKIRDEQLHEYCIIIRLEFIDTLIDWISEAKGCDKMLMMSDLKTLINLEDEFMLSSNSTNHYIGKDDHSFNETCKEILELNEELNKEL